MRLGRFVEWLRRALAPRDRRTVLVDNHDLQYQFYYDEGGRPVLEFLGGGIGQYPVKVYLTREQDQRWVQEGPPFIERLYHESIAAHNRGEAPAFNVAVLEQLHRDYGEIVRPIAQRHLQRYDAHHPEQTRVQLALLRVAGGDVHELARWAERALVDYRWILQRAGDIHQADPLPPGATGIDPATGHVVAREGTISPQLTRREFASSRLFEDGAWITRNGGEYAAAAITLTLGDARFNPGLRFDDERLTEVWLERPGQGAPYGWLKEHFPDWQDAFAWGGIDVEGDAIVIRYTRTQGGAGMT
jgi:hypothetical protein